MSEDQKFPQRWEFRRRDEDLDSSSIDTKSSFSSQPDMKKQKMALILYENNEGSDNPFQQESQVNHDSSIPFELGKAEQMQVEPSGKGKAVKNKKKRVSAGKGKRKKNNCKNHEPVPLDGFILLENDEGSGNPFTPLGSQVSHDTGMPSGLGKADKMQSSAKSDAVKNKMKRDSMGKGKRKKNNWRKHKAVSMDNFKIFVKSITEELKAAREKMFAWMREEMQKLVAAELASRLKKKKGRSKKKKIGEPSCKNNIEGGIKAQSHNGESLEISLRSDRKTDSSNCHVVLKELANQDQAIRTITANEKERAERSKSSSMKQVYSSALSNPVITSPYSVLPTALPEAYVENYGLHSSLNYIQPGLAGSKAGLNSERAIVCFDASNQGVFFPSLQQAEQLGSFSQMGSQNIDHLDQHAQTSTLGTGFPMPLHQGTSSGFQHHKPSHFGEVIPRQPQFQSEDERGCYKIFRR